MSDSPPPSSGSCAKGLSLAPLGKYIKVKKETGMYTLVKLYYLLRI